MAISNIEPSIITAGDTISWRRSLADYPAPTWVLTYALVNAAGKISITAAADGTDHLVSVAAATTAGYTAGTYRWQAYVTNGSQRVTVGSGEVTIKPNFAAATTLDSRSHVKKVLDAIEAVIEGRASIDQEEYTIANRSLKRTPIAELLRLRQHYKTFYVQEQNAEKVAQGLFGKNKIYTRFS